MYKRQDGHLPFWLPGFVKFIVLKLYVFVCIAEINILLLFSAMLIHDFATSEVSAFTDIPIPKGKNSNLSDSGGKLL